MVLLQSIDLPIGKFKAPDFYLPATDGSNYSLKDFFDNLGLAVIFTCNHCPYAKASWPLLIDLAEEYQSQDVVFIAINPNDEDIYPEDSLDVMKEKVQEWNINFPYLRDKGQDTARAYQAQCTPDIYLFDRERNLYYHGRLNDNWQNPEDVESEDFRNALDRLLQGEPAPADQFPSMGCSIKWIKR